MVVIKALPIDSIKKECNSLSRLSNVPWLLITKNEKKENRRKEKGKCMPASLQYARTHTYTCCLPGKHWLILEIYAG